MKNSKCRIHAGLLAAIWLLAGCTTLQPNADPVVVRAEQSIQVAFATLDTFLKVDHANRELFKTSLPEVHKFAEYLRAPVGNPPAPRGISYIESAVKVKNAYKLNRTAENKASLVTALATLETLIQQTQAQLDQTVPD